MSSTNDQNRTSTKPTQPTTEGKDGNTQPKTRPSEVPQPATPRKGAEGTEMNKEGSPVAQQHDTQRKQADTTNAAAGVEDNADRKTTMEDANKDRKTNKEGNGH